MRPSPDPPPRPADTVPGGARPEDGWHQLVADSGDPARTRSLLAAVAGELLRELDTAALAACWFLCKGPHLRLRLRPAAAGGAAVGRLITSAQDRGAHVRTSIYEPETAGFGGTAGMLVAHDLFSTDTRCLLGHLTSAPDHPLRRELAVRLAVRLMRAAGLDWDEQGDVWARVAAHRTDPGPIPPRTVYAVRELLTSRRDTPSSPLSTDPRWPAAMDDAGTRLRELADTGHLHRGIRAVLAKHLLFLFNRHGVHGPELAVLSTAAARATFDEEFPMTHTPTSTADSVPGGGPDVQALRDGLADAIDRRHGFLTPQVQAAFRTVSRGHFLPGVPADEAYAARPVVTRRGPDGTSLSSASSPTLVAEMLELAEIEPGDDLLEIGAATGFNAALMAELAGEQGQVVTIELDPDLAAAAAANLATSPYAGRVEVRAGDGALGAPGRIFDRIVVTAGAIDVPAAWWDQLRPGGRLVVPLQLHGCGLTRALRLDRTSDDEMVSTRALVCGFVPMRTPDDLDPAREEMPGAGTATTVGDGVVIEHAPTDAAHAEGIAAALADHQAGQHWERWLGRTFAHAKGPAGHLDLWLATQTPGPFARLRVTRAARDAGIADPAPRWSGACLIDCGTLAYVTFRDLDNDTGELGVTAVGDNAAQLGETLTDAVTRWHDTASRDEPEVTIRRRSGAAYGDAVTVRWPAPSTSSDGAALFSM